MIDVMLPTQSLPNGPKSFSKRDAKRFFDSTDKGDLVCVRGVDFKVCSMWPEAREFFESHEVND